MSRLRVALVVPRYGLEVGGGAETLARKLAALLRDYADVTVLTSCALDYVTWENFFPAGASKLDGVPVLRFPVSEQRSAERFREACDLAYASPEDEELARHWMRAQGPNVPALAEYVAGQDDEYDVVVFVPYLYATTADALPLVANRAVLVPALHDEPPLRLRLFDEIFRLPQFLVFSTPEERELARRRFGVEDGRARVIGIGIDEPPSSDGARFRKASGVSAPYALCVGRLDASKGVYELVQHHRLYRAQYPDGVDLVLIGGGRWEDEPLYSWLHVLGFVPEETKHDALSGATVVVCPSPYESLSLAQLEAWVHERPTLSNAASPVLVGQARRSGGGLWYRNADEYRAMLDLLVRAEPLALAIGWQGQRYGKRYSSTRVKDEWLGVLTEVARSRDLTSPAARQISRTDAP